MCRYPHVLAPLALSFTLACATPPVRQEATALPATVTPGVSLALARHRAATLSDVRKALDVGLRAADRADGTVTISRVRALGAGDLVLDFRGKAVGDVVVNEKRVTDARWADDHIVIAASHLSAGANTVRIAFT